MLLKKKKRQATFHIQLPFWELPIYEKEKKKKERKRASRPITISENRAEHYHKLYSKLSWPQMERCVFVFEADVFWQRTRRQLTLNNGLEESLGGKKSLP